MEFVLKKMRSEKALGLDGITIEVWKSLGETALCWLTKVLNKIIMIRKMSKE